MVKRPNFRTQNLADILGDKIRNWYEAQLNVDYRTINEEDLVKTFMESASGTITKNAYPTYMVKNVIKDYVKWVKENKVIVQGYADPEPSTMYIMGSLLWIPTKFKFKVISATDTTQTFLDNWEASGSSLPIKLEKGVWYEGYSTISMDSVVANDKYSRDYGLRHFENMFFMDSYFYDIVK